MCIDIVKANTYPQEEAIGHLCIVTELALECHQPGSGYTIGPPGHRAWAGQEVSQVALVGSKLNGPPMQVSHTSPDTPRTSPGTQPLMCMRACTWAVPVGYGQCQVDSIPPENMALPRGPRGEGAHTHTHTHQFALLQCHHKVYSNTIRTSRQAGTAVRWHNFADSGQRQ